MCDAAVDRLFEQADLGPAALAAKGWALVASRVAMSFRGELRQGDAYDVDCGVSACGPQGVAVVCRIRSGAALRSVCELLIAGLDCTARSRRLLDTETLAAVSRIAVPGLRTPFDSLTGADGS